IHAEIQNTKNTSDISITSSNSLTSNNGYGIFANSLGTGGIDIKSSGDVSASKDAINAQGGGNIGIQSTGSTLSATNGFGIFAVSSGKTSDINVTNSASVSAKNDGIFAALTDTKGGAITIGNTGALGSPGTPLGGNGIFAQSAGTGDITVHNDDVAGAINANLGGLITIQDGKGTGGITIANAATVTAGSDAIHAEIQNSLNASDIKITNSGPLSSTNGTGIFATSTGIGAIDIASSDNLTAGADGIHAQLFNTASSGNLSVTNSKSL